MKSSLRRFVIMFVALFAMTFSINAMAKPKPVKTIIKEAATAYEKGEFDAAITKFNEAYEQDPQPNILYNLGRVYESKAEYDQANEYYKQFLMASGSDETAREDAIERIEKNNKTLGILGGAKKGKATKAGKAAKAGKAEMPAGGCIDINTADAAQLVNLNGVGEATANNIIATRPFKNFKDITRTPKIGAKTLEKFQSQLCPFGDNSADAADDAPADAPKAAKAKKAAKVKTADDAAPAKAAKAAKKAADAPSGGVLDI